MSQPSKSLFNLLVVLCALIAAACRDQPRAYRGAGLNVAALPTNDRVAVYRAALAGSFRLDDPTLFILADTMLLPRDEGLTGGTPLPSDVRESLRGAGVVKGMCQLQERRAREPLICDAARAGYVVRFSEPFGIGPDTIQVHVVVQQYATPYGPRAQRLRFERAYQVARAGVGWRAIREARLPQP